MKYIAIVAVIVLAFFGFTFSARAATILFPTGGGTGKGTFTTGLLGASGINPFFTQATTTASCSGSASCTPFTVIGSSPITISATGGTGGTGNVATSSTETSTYIPFWTSTGATPATLSGGDSGFIWNNTAKRLTATYASTTGLTVSGSTYLATAGGNVGIGTTSPNELLTVGAGANTSGSRTTMALGNGGWGVPTAPNSAKSNGEKIVFYDNNVNTRTAIGFGSSNDIWFQSTNATPTNEAFRFYAGGTSAVPTEIVTMLNNGNIGIGTTSPLAKLDIFGNAIIGTGSAANSVLSFRDANSTNLYRTITDNGTAISIANTEAGGTVLNLLGNSGGTDYFTADNIDVINFNSGQFYLRQSDGNVGIGTTSPNNKLHISDAAATDVRFQITNATTGFGASDGLHLSIDSVGDAYLIQREAANLKLYTNNTPTSGITINSSGSVGIGNASPLGKLDVSGNILSRGAAVSYTGITNAGVLNYDTLGGTLDLAAYSTGGNTSMRFTTSNAGTPGTRMTITSAGNVGIGSTSPYAKLSIVDGGGTNDTTLALNDRFRFSGDGVMKWGTASNAGILSWDTNVALIGSQPGNDLVFLTNGTGVGAEKMRITTGGNVGIGTTTPATKLAIYGSAGSASTLNINDSGYLSVHSQVNNRVTALGTNAYWNGSNYITYNAAESGLVFEAHQGAGAFRFVRVAAGGGALSVDASIGINGGNSYFNANGGNVGVGSSSPSAILSVGAPAGSAPFMVGSTTKTLLQVGAKGKLEVLDVGTGYSGVVSSLRQLGFQTGTTTTWTGSTTGAYINKLVVPFAGTIRQAICDTDTGTLGVDIYHTSTHLAYLNASTTKGTVKFTSNNTVTAGETLYMVAGTPASSPTSLTCTIGITETP